MATVQSGTERGRDVPRKETASLISSDKVEGTTVYGPDGLTDIGRIENVMIGKRSGRVAYAVLSFGGFLGVGSDHIPLPWSMLTYDEQIGGYRLDIMADKLKNAPRYTEGDSFNWPAVDTYYNR